MTTAAKAVMPAGDRLRTRTLVEQVAQSLERAILIGELQPGRELRQEELCASFGISRTPVREALRRLEAQGMVELLANRTALVRRLAHADVADLYEVRADLEGRACERAASRLTTEVMHEIEDAQAELERVSARLTIVPDGVEPADLHDRLRIPNDRFHTAIHEAGASPLLSELIKQVWNRFPKDYVWRMLSRDEDVVGLNCDQHREIMAALASRRPATARRAMRDHVLRSGDLLIDYLDRKGYWSTSTSTPTSTSTSAATPATPDPRPRRHS